jgi:hypothetical protein
MKRAAEEELIETPKAKRVRYLYREEDVYGDADANSNIVLSYSDPALGAKVHAFLASLDNDDITFFIAWLSRRFKGGNEEEEEGEKKAMDYLREFPDLGPFATADARALLEALTPDVFVDDFKQGENGEFGPIENGRAFGADLLILETHYSAIRDKKRRTSNKSKV